MSTSGPGTTIRKFFLADMIWLRAGKQIRKNFLKRVLSISALAGNWFVEKIVFLRKSEIFDENRMIKYFLKRETLPLDPKT